MFCYTCNANRLDLLNSVNVILLPQGLINLSNEELLISSSMAMNSYRLNAT